MIKTSVKNSQVFLNLKCHENVFDENKATTLTGNCLFADVNCSAVYFAFTKIDTAICTPRIRAKAATSQICDIFSTEKEKWANDLVATERRAKCFFL